MPAAPESNFFLDTIIGKFSTRAGLMNSVANVVWDEPTKTALIHVRTQDPEQFDTLKELLADSLKEIESVKFKASGSVVRVGSVPSLVLKLKHLA